MAWYNVKSKSQEPYDTSIDVDFYRDLYFDLMQMSNEELINHWNLLGKKEGRFVTFTDLLAHYGTDEGSIKEFEYDFYVSHYDDLQDKIKTYYQAIHHFLEFGIIEHRHTSLTAFLESIGFDHQAYLKANQDVHVLIDEGKLKDVFEHLKVDGFNEIKDGKRKFHYGFAPYDVTVYLKNFPNVQNDIKKSDFDSYFKHFLTYGYQGILSERIDWKKADIKKVIVVLGIPRSGTTMMTALLGGNCDSTTWFLPYATRPNATHEPFKNFVALDAEYCKTFPNEKPLKNTVILSESTANLQNIDLIVKSLQNFEKEGVETHIVWMTRDIHHTYLSQMEAAFKYWGGMEPIYNQDTYSSYVQFVKKGYLKLIELASDFNVLLVGYESFIKSPQKNLKAIYESLEVHYFPFSEKLNLVSRYVAGDPSFNCHVVLKEQAALREEKWLKLNELDILIAPELQVFVDVLKERKKILKQGSVPFEFATYKQTLLKKYFDVEYYNTMYQDISDNNVDPIEHYLIYGWKENRNPNEDFETRWYRENIFDDDKTPSFLHYLLIGRFTQEAQITMRIMENLKIIEPIGYKITDDLLLEAPKFKNPKVSIIIPAYNQETYTMACIQSIIENTEEGVSYEIIVMDDKSPDESARLIEKNLKHVKFITNGVNYGFLLNCNKGATFAIGEYLLFLNNDTNVQPGWLSSLVELIESADDIGMVGSRLVYPTGQQQEAGGIVWNDASGWNFGRLDDPHKPEYNYVKEADYLTGAAMMIRTSLWEEIGGFDTRYVPAYYEDTDLAFEARKHGYRTLYQPKSVVIHFEGISNGTDLGSGIKKYQVVNKENFYNKWEKVLTKDQFPNAKEVFLARDRSANKSHLLYVDHYLPHYDQDAGSKATFQYLKILSEQNIQIHFVGDNFYDYPDTPYLDKLQQMGIEVLHGNWYAKNFKKWFSENGKYFNYVVLSRPHIAEKYIDLVRKYSDAKIIYMGHDLHFLREEREYKIKEDMKYLESSQKWKMKEMKLIEQSNVSYFFSDIEKQEILKIDNNASVDVVPLYIYDHFQEISILAHERQDIMFVGGFAHSPNTDAMLWFVDKIWPIIVESLPEIKLYIIGSKAPEEILDLASNSVIVTGFVDDVALLEFYRRCKIVVAPLRYGAGIKGKIVDALYYGMPVVTTSIGAEGLLDADGIMIIEDKPNKFAAGVIKLYRDDTLVNKYAAKALAYCKNHFSTSVAKEKLSHIFNEFKERV